MEAFVIPSLLLFVLLIFFLSLGVVSLFLANRKLEAAFHTTIDVQIEIQSKRIQDVEEKLTEILISITDLQNRVHGLQLNGENYD